MTQSCPTHRSSELPAARAFAAIRRFSASETSTTTLLLRVSTAVAMIASMHMVMPCTYSRATADAQVNDRAAQARAPSETPPELCRNAASTRSEEHTSELQSLLRISYAVFCLKKKNK